mmetsp:Transcript_25675/g.81490  ORF Transcript_25675/g.81490 Transcript_25675/m.81490 type:complete len:376 (+) Transcript_25675:663-1790(+)
MHLASPIRLPGLLRVLLRRPTAAPLRLRRGRLLLRVLLLLARAGPSSGSTTTASLAGHTAPGPPLALRSPLLGRRRRHLGGPVVQGREVADTTEAQCRGGQPALVRVRAASLAEDPVVDGLAVHEDLLPLPNRQLAIDAALRLEARKGHVTPFLRRVPPARGRRGCGLGHHGLHARNDVRLAAAARRLWLAQELLLLLRARRPVLCGGHVADVVAGLQLHVQSDFSQFGVALQRRAVLALQRGRLAVCIGRALASVPQIRGIRLEPPAPRVVEDELAPISRLLRPLERVGVTVDESLELGQAELSQKFSADLGPWVRLPPLLLLLLLLLLVVPCSGIVLDRVASPRLASPRPSVTLVRPHVATVGHHAAVTTTTH